MAEQLLEGSLEGADYDPGLYESVEVAPCVDGFANVTEAGIARFNRDGFLSVSGAFSKKQAADNFGDAAEPESDASRRCQDSRGGTGRLGFSPAAENIGSNCARITG